MTRILVTGSSDGIGVHTSGGMAWDDLMGERQFSGYAAYAQSKLANLPCILQPPKEVEGVTGSYFVNRRETRPSSLALDDAAAQGLWDLSERLVGM